MPPRPKSNASMSSPPSAQLRTGAGTHNHWCLLMRSLWPQLWPNNEHWWLWVPDRARSARLSGTTEIDSIFKTTFRHGRGSSRPSTSSLSGMPPILRPSLRGAKRRSNPFFLLRGKMDCFAWLAMTSNFKYDSAFPRREAPEVLQEPFAPRSSEGAGNAGCPMHP
jgi:hypothetical protein